MKKFFTFILAMVLVFTTFSNTVFAVETMPNEAAENNEENNEGIMPLGSTSTSGTMSGGTPAKPELNNIGTSPTFVFSISGNPDLYVDVDAVDPIGRTFTLFSNIKCDGTSHRKFHYCAYRGNYIFTIRVNHGSSAGQKKPFTISASW